jgi:peptide/nickel transport system permease protein
MKKLALLVVTLLVISLLVFIAFQLIPGDPVSQMLGTEYTESRAAALRTELGLDAPVITRYFKWLVGFVTGDLGISYSYKTPVSELLGDKIVVTALLSALAFLLVVVISIPVGLLLARFQGGIVDRVMVVVNQITMSIPPFFIGIIFTCIFGFFLKLFTPGDFISYKDSVSGFLGYIFFPALAIALPKSAMTVKLLRRSMIRETHEDYVRTAYSRGNSRATVLRSHVLRNAILPVITFLAMTLADIVAGSIIIEQVFTIPGVGRMLLLSISNRDYPVVQAIVVMIAFVVVFMNFLADIANQYIDPRIRLS